MGFLSVPQGYTPLLKVGHQFSLLDSRFLLCYFEWYRVTFLHHFFSHIYSYIYQEFCVLSTRSKTNLSVNRNRHYSPFLWLASSKGNSSDEHTKLTSRFEANLWYFMSSVTICWRAYFLNIRLRSTVCLLMGANRPSTDLHAIRLHDNCITDSTSQLQLPTRIAPVLEACSQFSSNAAVMKGRGVFY